MTASSPLFVSNGAGSDWYEKQMMNLLTNNDAAENFLKRHLPGLQFQTYSFPDPKNNNITLKKRITLASLLNDALGLKFSIITGSIGKSAWSEESWQKFDVYRIESKTRINTIYSLFKKQPAINGLGVYIISPKAALLLAFTGRKDTPTVQYLRKQAGLIYPIPSESVIKWFSLHEREVTNQTKTKLVALPSPTPTEPRQERRVEQYSGDVDLDALLVSTRDKKLEMKNNIELEISDLTVKLNQLNKDLEKIDLILSV